MPAFSIRRIDNALMVRLRVEAARQACSIEELVRRALYKALSAAPDQPANQPASMHLVYRIQARFAAAGGVDLPVPPR